jgi:hypothetical protein
LGRIGEGKNPSPLFFRHPAKLTWKATSEIYRKKPGSGSNLVASVQSITNDLSAWLRQIPDQLRIDFTTLDSHINRESVSINLHFYSCVNMTARPLVFYVIQRRLDAEALGSTTEDWKEGLAPNTVAVIDSCITAARATTMIMEAAAKHNLVGTWPQYNRISSVMKSSDQKDFSFSYIWIPRWRIYLLRCTAAGHGERRVSA